jgi:hypothetical protein
MASRGNPNVPSKSKRKANRSKVQSKVQKHNSGKISKNPRGTAPSSVLHATSGPSAPISSKKARKLTRAQNHARRRALEEAMAREGEVVMTGKVVLLTGEALLMISRCSKNYEGQDYED